MQQKIEQAFVRLGSELGYSKEEVTRIIARACFAAGVKLAIDWLFSQDWYNDDTSMEKVYLLEDFSKPIESEARELGLDEIVISLSDSRGLEERLLELEERLHQEWLAEKTPRGR